MGKRKSYEPGTFCWVDLSTDDAEGDRAFYGGLFGWEFRDDEIPGGIYVTRHGSGDAVGAIDQQDERPARWNNYVSVACADGTAARDRPWRPPPGRATARTLPGRRARRRLPARRHR